MKLSPKNGGNLQCNNKNWPSQTDLKKKKKQCLSMASNDCQYKHSHNRKNRENDDCKNSFLGS